MTVSIQDIRDAFDAVLSGKSTREEISSWASSLMNAHDEQRLEFTNRNDEEAIWDALIWLQGGDLRVNESAFLHNLEEYKENRPQRYIGG